MAEITVESTDATATAEAVASALVTGYVILNNDDAGTATIVTDEHTEEALASAVAESPNLTESTTSQERPA